MQPKKRAKILVKIREWQRSETTQAEASQEVRVKGKRSDYFLVQSIDPHYYLQFKRSNDKISPYFTMIILKPIEEIKFTPDYEAGEPVFLEMFESTMLEMQV